LFLRDRVAVLAGGVVAAMLALLAMIFPIDTAVLIGSLSLKISASIQILGRSFILNAADGPLLAMIYGLGALWFFGTQAAGVTPRFVSLGLAILALLVASLAVEPFLYAALLLEMAALLIIPLLVMPHQPPGRGILRFLISQTLAMPFILFSGWMLAGVEASPGDIGLTTQSGILLSLGFALLLAVFPLYSWIPMLTEEAHPYVVGFLLWALPVFGIIFAMDFLDRYAWLRTSPQMISGFQIAGLLMLVSGGVFAAFQRHIGRLMGYAAIAGTGSLILSLGLRNVTALEITFLILIPRGLELAVWSLGVSILRRKAPSLRFRAVQGLARVYPIAVTALVLGNLSSAGFPLLAGFPPRLALWEQLAIQSLGYAAWMLLGIFGLLTAAIRTLAVLVMAPEHAPWALNETWLQRTLLGIGLFGLLVLGLFPQVMQPFLSTLPAMFEHLGQ
jgi:NADH-quinone oxidoreductase subunit N